ncbi:MAG: prolipoprotein diacylglyceryl transferase, partial [Verrucomicrobia bacterium]|nr:prolipoprotein diacylglyceryl transferase [Verrucomicrobiota bacterium]
MNYRIAFEIAGHPIYWYGIMFALGIMAGLWTGSRRANLTADVSSEQFLNSVPWVLIGTLVGAR